MATVTTQPPTGAWASAVVTMHATPGNATEVVLPSWVRAVQVRLITSGGAADSGTVCHTGTDGAAADASAFVILSGEVLPMSIQSEEQSNQAVTLFISAGTASAIAHLALYESQN